MSSHRALAGLSPLLLVPLGGCCGLAAMFCGPDRSTWVSERYDNPEAALTTFLEAVRRDNARVLCEALSPEFRARLGIRGCFETALAWEKLKEQTTALHLLGDAARSEPQELSADRVRYRLTVSGHQLEAELVRLPKVGVRYRIDGFEEPMESYVGDLTDFLRLSDRQVELRLPTDGLPPEVDASDLLEVFGIHEWKVDHLAEAAPPPVGT